MTKMLMSHSPKFNYLLLLQVRGASTSVTQW